MRKICVFLLSILTVFILIGCGQIKEKNTTLKRVNLTEREKLLMNLSGNNILLYEIENFKGEGKYNLSISYEVYENGELVKEHRLGVIRGDAAEREASKNWKLGINLLDDEIKYVVAEGGAIYSGGGELDEDLSEYGRTSFASETTFNKGSEVYIYYGIKSYSISAELPLGKKIDDEVMKKLLEKKERIMLIKLSYK